MNKGSMKGKFGSIRLSVPTSMLYFSTDSFANSPSRVAGIA